MHHRRGALAAMVSIMLISTACSAQEPARTVTVLTPAASPTGPASGASGSGTPAPSSDQSGKTSSPGAASALAGDTTRSDVDQAELPDTYCQLPSGVRLSGGSYSGGTSKPAAWLNKEVEPVSADLDGSGSKRMFAAVMCTAGGVGWPDMLLEVGPRGQLLAHTDMRSTLTAAYPTLSWDRGTMTSLSVTRQGLAITFRATSGAMPVATLRGWFTLKDGQFAFTKDTNDPFAGAVFTTEGDGPILVGMSRDELIATGYGKRYGSDGVQCPGATLTDEARSHGIEVINDSSGRVSAVMTRSPAAKTRSGAYVGMSVTALKALYGDQISPGTTGVQAPVAAYFLVTGNHSLIFQLDADQKTVVEIDAAAVTQGPIPHGSDFC